MKRHLLILIFYLILAPFAAKASLGNDLSGLILLNVEKNGEAWYVWPENNRRYFLGRPTDAFEIMRELGLGITDNDFQRLAQAGMPVTGDLALAKRLSGRIVIQVEQNGEAWYIYPKNLKKYYLGRPDDAFRIMRELSLGITRDNLAQVHKLGIDESLDQYSSYEHKTVNITSGAFAVDLVKIDMANPNLKIITDTSLSIDCDKNCPAQSLGSFAGENNGFAGINGTYFCSSGGCEPNYYFFPVYNSTIGRFVNEDQLKYWTTGPIMAWDVNNKFYYFKDSREFIGVKEFESTYNTKLQAALGNKPRLIEDGKNLLIEWDIDEKQRNQKALRNAIAVKDNWIYLVVASNATVPELADIIKAMAVEYALNLDGGYSSALWYNDEYMVGPGRDVPNAIVFGEK